MLPKKKGGGVKQLNGTLTLIVKSFSVIKTKPDNTDDAILTITLHQGDGGELASFQKTIKRNKTGIDEYKTIKHTITDVPGPLSVSFDLNDKEHFIAKTTPISLGDDLSPGDQTVSLHEFHGGIKGQKKGLLTFSVSLGTPGSSEPAYVPTGIPAFFPHVDDEKASCEKFSVHVNSSKHKAHIRLYETHLCIPVSKVLPKSKTTTKEKEREKSAFIPWALLWMHHKPATIRTKTRKDSSKKTDETVESVLEVFGPENNFRLSGPPNEIQELAKLLNDHVDKICTKYNIMIDRRVCLYSYQNKMTFKGGWLRGRPHGKGELVKDRESFIGLWDADLCAGSGKVTHNTSLTVRHDVGWAYEPNQIDTVHVPKQFASEELIQGTEFYCSDLDKLLDKSQSLRYNKNDCILKEGAVNSQLYYLKDGVLKILQTKNGKEVEIAKISNGQFFGELSVLDKQTITASVKVDSEFCDMLVVDKQLLLRTLKDNPEICLRFYKHIAKALSLKIRNFEPNNASQARITQALNNWSLVSKQIKSSVTVQSKLKEALPDTQDKITSRPSTSVSHLLVSSGPDEVDPFRATIDKFIKAMNNRDLTTSLACFQAGASYLDPYEPQGIVGDDALKNHFTKLFSKETVWTITPAEVFKLVTSSKNHTKYTVRGRMALPNKQGQIWVMVFLCFSLKSKLLIQCEFFYDREALHAVDSPAGDTDGRDVDFRNLFGIKGFERVIYETESSLVLESGVKTSGKLFLTQRHLCFHCQIFGFDGKYKFPLKYISSATKKIVNGEEILHCAVDRPTQLDDSQNLTFLFQRPELLESVLSKLNAVLVQTQASTTPRAGKSTIEIFLEREVPHLKLPPIPIKPIPTEKCIRIQGPNANTSVVNFGSHVAGLSISNYPYISTNKDGTIHVDKNTHQGDPICDQFAIDRFETQTIFAIADGCNWGNKPRKAAYNASRKFLDFARSKQIGFFTVQELGKICAQGFHHAHEAIMADLPEGADYWQVGTTTMIGGAIVQLDQSEGAPWGVVCAGVGDCKAFHFSVKDGGRAIVEEITIGSRNISNITDATDPGGRLGPFDKGKPDLRNFEVWFQEAQEGDLIMLCSDGVHDNLDPQSQGKSPREFDLDVDDWKKADPAQVTSIKTNYANASLQDFYRKACGAPNILTKLATDIVKFSKKLTKSSRKFMEGNPTSKLPTDYTQFPGKMDHCTCVFIRVGKSSMTKEEKGLDVHVMRMRNQTSGPAFQQTGKNGGFIGASLCRWFMNSEKLQTEQAEIIAQNLLSFQYIKKISEGGFETAFNAEYEYSFQVYDPIMSKEDWESLRKIFSVRKYPAGATIIEQEMIGDSKLYQIVSGECDVIQLKGSHNTVLGQLKPPDVFGELNFLEGKAATARVVAKVDCQIYEIEQQGLNLIYAAHPGLVARFYHYLATVVAKRLQSLEIG